MHPEASHEWYLRLLDHEHFIPVAGMVVGIVAIVAATTAVIVLSKLWLSHRQRMEMIARGMHPDLIADDGAAEAYLDRPSQEPPAGKIG